MINVPETQWGVEYVVCAELSDQFGTTLKIWQSDELIYLEEFKDSYSDRPLSNGWHTMGPGGQWQLHGAWTLTR